MTFNLTLNENLYNLSGFAKLSYTTLSTTTPHSIPLENRLPIMITFISLYALIFFFGITGNALVVCT